MKDYDIYWDGQWLKYSDAKLPLLTQTLHYGFGAFEGVRAYETEQGAAIFRLTEHTQRLLRSASILNMPLQETAAQLEDVQRELLRRNKLTNCYLRPLIFLGESQLNMDPASAPIHIMIAAWPFESFHHQYKNGIKLTCVPYRRQSGSPELLKAKAIGHYLTSGAAIQKAKQSGAHEALLLDPEGYVCEASAQNILMIKDDQLIASASNYALDGITQDAILKIGQDLGMQTIQKLFTLDELVKADAVFLTGTATEILPVVSLDNHIFNSQQHLRLMEIMTTFKEVVHGKRSEYSGWLSHI